VTSDELADRVLDFAVAVCKMSDSLPNSRLGRHVAGQIVRCATSPGPNYEEACAASSHRDFTHKLSICLKETRETRFWLRLIERAELLKSGPSPAIIDEARELANIFASSILTSKSRPRPAP